MDCLIVGAGEMGRWVGGVLAERFGVAFADTDPAAAQRAAEATGAGAVAIDAGIDTEGGDGERFDAVCLAVPMPALSDAVAAQAPRAGRAVFDVTGTMTPAVDAMRRHAPDRERLSAHPLFAPAAAPGRVPIVVDEPGPVTDAVRAALSAAGNDLFETDPETHDRAMATVQARTHAAVLAFALAREEVPERFHTPVSATLSELADRVTDGNPRVYADVQAAFEGAGDVATAAERVADADGAAFERLYREAGATGSGDGQP
jgi:prephenate dehydrogenase